MSLAFSATMMTGMLVFPLIMRGMIEASTTRSPSTPCTRRAWSTTASRSVPNKVVYFAVGLHLAAGCKFLAAKHIERGLRYQFPR
jgi:hypothetical protein